MTLSAVLEGRERWHIENLDVMSGLRLLPDESVHTCVTSPPYWGLRTYGVEGQLGLEPTPELFIEHMVEVFREVWRVLRRDGQLWLNLGDSYVAGPTGHQDISSANGKAAQMFAKGGRYRVDNLRKDTGRHFGGLPAKSLMMMPARVAIALQQEGWILRSEITWCKKAPMPESVKDRPTSATEKIYLLSKSPRYYFDMDAVREKAVKGYRDGFRSPRYMNNHAVDNSSMDYAPSGAMAVLDPNSGRNLWNWWLIGPEPFPMAHFATFPTEIPRRCILAGTSAHGVCGTCGAPWRRVVERSGGNWEERKAAGAPMKYGLTGTKGTPLNVMGSRDATVTTLGWQPTCTHAEAPVVGAVVLDPFAGSGTTLMVALRHGRRAVGLELSAEYTEMARERIVNDAPLFNMREVG